MPTAGRTDLRAWRILDSDTGAALFASLNAHKDLDLGLRATRRGRANVAAQGASMCGTGAPVDIRDQESGAGHWAGAAVARRLKTLRCL
jgi:hypothetical protein